MTRADRAVTPDSPQIFFVEFTLVKCKLFNWVLYYVVPTV
ncbi:hypothetical protein LEP1GSC186_4705 [Leptospira noguchii serovar Autumnalis str. ZUN142]|uniref:Uncharacterized protein n=1 Tax=Leptospira noguchii serovar Autumnalis str. ZUN142 TaxID=1085540 RepID=M6UE40_9LEPT|nr:hypothetical protein LEP1GSC186_4705 [Leptospira noguchii serovar Autumnalis str. ZUN142]